MSGGDAVTTHGISKRYGRETALDGVNLRVPEGAVYVLVGANGAGKSTTLKVLMNLERADAGTAEIHGLDTVRRGPEARAQVGYVSERPNHGYRWMTCRGLLKHVAAYYPTWDHPYADRLSLAFGLRLDRKVATRSLKRPFDPSAPLLFDFADHVDAYAGTDRAPVVRDR